jgi:hypothetical protein
MSENFHYVQVVTVYFEWGNFVNMVIVFFGNGVGESSA